MVEQVEEVDVAKRSRLQKLATLGMDKDETRPAVQLALKVRGLALARNYTSLARPRCRC